MSCWLRVKALMAQQAKFSAVNKTSLKPAPESFWILSNCPPMNRLQWLNCTVVCFHKCLAFPVPGGGRALCLSDFEGSAALTYRAAGADHAGHGCHRGPRWTLMCPCPRPRGFHAPAHKGFLYVGSAPCLSTSRCRSLSILLPYLSEELTVRSPSPPTPYFPSLFPFHLFIQ